MNDSGCVRKIMIRVGQSSNEVIDCILPRLSLTERTLLVFWVFQSGLISMQFENHIGAILGSGLAVDNTCFLNHGPILALLYNSRETVASTMNSYENIKNFFL